LCERYRNIASLWHLILLLLLPVMPVRVSLPQPDLYQRLSGTSMAVPHVTGALARIWADFPNCRSDVVRRAIEESALDLGPRGKDTMFGYGLLQTQSAYDWLAAQPCAKQGFTSERGQRQQYDASRQQNQTQAQQQQQQGQQQQGQQQGQGQSKSAGSGTGIQQLRNLLQQQHQQHSMRH
jgi:hypothetical protein